jgi:glucan phosphoethanolaminetransferase (alkaline phosphatase superfamily)
MNTVKNIDEFKNDFKNMKASYKKSKLMENGYKNINDFLQLIKKQDRDDERYLIRKKIRPVFIGLIILTILFMFYRIPNIIMFAGCFIVYGGLVTILILFFRDYRNISKEPFDLTLYEYLENKQKRLRSWKSTPGLYNALFILFILGVTMMIIGNTSLVHDLKTTLNLIIYISANIAALIISWFVAENLYKKRHKKKHIPLIKSISELIADLGIPEEDTNNSKNHKK